MSLFKSFPFAWCVFEFSCDSRIHRGGIHCKWSWKSGDSLCQSQWRNSKRGFCNCWCATRNSSRSATKLPFHRLSSEIECLKLHFLNLVYIVNLKVWDYNFKFIFYSSCREQWLCFWFISAWIPSLQFHHGLWKYQYSWQWYTRKWRRVHCNLDHWWFSCTSESEYDHRNHLGWWW